MLDLYENGIPVVISGPSGSGKGTVVAEILKRSQKYVLSVSATTRAPRPGEVDGKHYYFITKENFKERIAAGKMLEYASYVDHFYGTPRDEVQSRLNNGINVILEIEVQGALQIKHNLPEAVLIFLMPPDAKTQEQRLRGRKTNTEEDIQKRMQRTRKELEYFGEYNYVVINSEGDVAATANKIMQIVECEKNAVRRNPAFAEHYFDNQEM